MRFGSTQDYIRERLEEGQESDEELDRTKISFDEKVEKSLPHGTVVIAENQTAGKGTNGRKWKAARRI